MPRQSMIFTEPNDDCLNAQVGSLEYISKSEVVNDLIRRARQQEEEIEIIRARLTVGEKSGFSD